MLGAWPTMQVADGTARARSPTDARSNTRVDDPRDGAPARRRAVTFLRPAARLERPHLRRSPQDVRRRSGLSLPGSLETPASVAPSAGLGVSERARPTCSTVITPLRRPSASTAIRAPRRRRFWFESRESRGVSSRTKRPRSCVDDFADGGAGAGDLGDLVGGVAVEQAEEAVGGVDDREPGPAVAEEVLVEGLLDRDLAGDRDRFAVHHVGDRDRVDVAGHPGLDRGAAGGAVDHHPDQRQPDAAEGAEDRVGQRHVDAGGDEEVAEDAAEVGGELGRRVAVPGHLPGDRAGDPAAVHREGRQQVEDQQQQVDRGEPGDHRQDPVGAGAGLDQRRLAEVVPAAGQDAADRQHGEDREGHRRAGEGDPRFHPRAVGFAVHPRHAAEDPELDRADPDPVAAGGDGVAELVQEDRAEEAGGARQAEQERRGRAARVTQQVAVEVGHPEDDQEEDQEPGPVHGDADAADVEQGYRAAAEHRSMVSG